MRLRYHGTDKYHNYVYVDQQEYMNIIKSNKRPMSAESFTFVLVLCCCRETSIVGCGRHMFMVISGGVFIVLVGVHFLFYSQK